MQQKKGLTLEGLTTRNFVFIFLSLAMVGVSIYLTTHFYDTHFPTKLGGPGSLCDMSAFFNCDAATHSKASNIIGVPISFFGMIVGLLFLFSALMPGPAMEKTASAVSKYNFIGCLALFVFSLVELGSLCPFCTVYYALSGACAYLFWKYGAASWVPDVKVAGLWAAILLAGSYGVHAHTKSKEIARNSINKSIVEQFRALANNGDPDQESPYKIHVPAGMTFATAPIRVTVFSDFECPFCKVVSEQMPDFIRRYGDKVAIQYMFYPLDNKCNPNVKSPMHRNACDAAMVAACDEKKFPHVHDEIFAKQDSLKDGALLGIASSNGLNGCLDRADIKERVISSINQGTKFNLKSTPTIIVNGRKIEGTIPSNQFFAIFEDILAGNK